MSITIIYFNYKDAIQGGDCMPRLDGTGPEGKGPKTGRGLGNCEENERNSKEDFRRGPGRGRGFSR